MAGGEQGDDPHAEPLALEGVGVGLGQARVQLGEAGGSHADARVLHGEHHLAGLQEPAGELDLGVGRREGGGVLQELRDQVAQVVRGEAGDLGVRRQGLEGDPLVPLDLADSGAQHVDERDGPGVAVDVLVAGEDEEVLAVAAHDGRHVVELEEGAEAVRVLLALLQLLDDAELALDEPEVAQGEVDEGVPDGAAELFELGGEEGDPPLELGALGGELGGEGLLVGGQVGPLGGEVPGARGEPGELAVQGVEGADGLRELVVAAGEADRLLGGRVGAAASGRRRCGARRAAG